MADNKPNSANPIFADLGVPVSPTRYFPGFTPPAFPRKASPKLMSYWEVEAIELTIYCNPSSGLMLLGVTPLLARSATYAFNSADWCSGFDSSNIRMVSMISKPLCPGMVPGLRSPPPPILRINPSPQSLTWVFMKALKTSRPVLYRPGVSSVPEVACAQLCVR